MTMSRRRINFGFIFTALSSVLALLSCHTGMASAFRNGDIVRTLKQSHFNGVTLGWTEMLADDSPRFLQERVSQLPSLAADPSDKNIAYKVAFSFVDEKFITPLITISDGKGTFVEAIKFIFVYSENDIVDLRWTVDYNTDRVNDHQHKSDPSKFFIHYGWERFADKNADLGMAVLFFSGFAVGALLFLYVLVATGVETPSSTRLPTRAMPSTSTTPTSVYSNAPASAYEIPLRQRLHKPATTVVETAQQQPSGVAQESFAIPTTTHYVQDDSFADFVGSSGVDGSSLQQTSGAIMTSAPPSPVVSSIDDEALHHRSSNTTPKYD